MLSMMRLLKARKKRHLAGRLLELRARVAQASPPDSSKGTHRAKSKNVQADDELQIRPVRTSASYEGMMPNFTRSR